MSFKFENYANASVSVLLKVLLVLSLGIAVASEVRGGSVSLNWRWSDPQAHGNNIIDLQFNDGLYVQATDGGRIYSSEDRATWTIHESGTVKDLRAIIYFGGRLIATGESGTVLYADSLDSFVLGTLSDSTEDWLEGVAASESLVVAVGDNGTIFTSGDGINWQLESQPFETWLTDVAYGNGRFIAVGETGFVATSIDGFNWTVQASGVQSTLYDIEWIGDQFWAVGEGGTVIRSGTGNTWALDNLDSAESIFTISGDGTQFLAAGESAVFYKAEINSNWIDQLAIEDSSDLPTWTYLRGLWDGSQFVLGGRTGVMVQYGPTEENAANVWSHLTESNRSWIWDLLTLESGLYVAVGDLATIQTSQDGIDWTLEAVPAAATNKVLLGVGGSSNGLVAVGSQGLILHSPAEFTEITETNLVDGESVLTNTMVSTLGVVWNEVTAPTENDLQGVVVNDNQFFVSGGEGQILSSPDGTNWVVHPTQSTAFISSLASFGEGIVATGDEGTILYSSTGSDWSAQEHGLQEDWIFKVRYLNGHLVAVGENGSLATSTNGVDWITRVTGSTAWLNDVSFFAGRYFAIGNQGTVLCSEDLVTWETVEMITRKSLFGVAHNGSAQLIVVGVEGVVLRSNLIQDLEPVEIIEFSRLRDDEALTEQALFLIAGNPDQRFTLDHSSTLNGSWEQGPLLEFTDSSGTLLFLEELRPEEIARFYRATLEVDVAN
jgi:hypothetical protein